MAELRAQPAEGRRAELHRLADAARRLLNGMVMTDAPIEDLRDAADAVERVAAVFERPERRSMHEGWTESANAGDAFGFFDHSPMLGRANPIAPPIDVFPRDERSVTARARFGAAYEGPPGCVHGGYVAAAFDEVLGTAQSLSGQPGMTVGLEISYRAPTPLHEDLELVGTFERVEGRKIFTSGTLTAGGTTCATATAVFVSVDFARFAELRARRAEAEEARREG